VFDINPNFDFNNPNAVAPFTVTMQGFTIANGLAPERGGGIKDSGTASLTLNDMVLTGNAAPNDGGAVVMSNKVSTAWTLTINNSIITNNVTGNAGAGVDGDGHGTININNTLIANNHSAAEGGGVWADDLQAGTVFQTPNVTITNSTITGNTAGAVAGGVGNGGDGTMTIANSTITNNSSADGGGGFGDSHGMGTLNIANSVIENNRTGGNGGGVSASGPVTTITNTQIAGNTSAALGGGLFAGGVTLTLQNSTLANNNATNGGGIELQTTGKGLFQGSTITNVTLTGNRAFLQPADGGANGGGIDLPAAFTGDVKLTGATIDANIATSAGGGLFWAGAGNVGVANTILAGNFANAAPDVSTPAMNTLGGTLLDLGGNLVGVAGAAGGNTVFTSATTQTGTLTAPLNPMLGKLQNNGGPTIGARDGAMTLQTQAPMAGSPAIGKGILSQASATDERGLPSIVNGQINVGAVSEAKVHHHHGFFEELNEWEVVGPPAAQHQFDFFFEGLGDQR
jgi:hypothetical protein